MSAKEVLVNGNRYYLEDYKKYGEKAIPINSEKELEVDVFRNERSGKGLAGSAAVVEQPVTNSDKRGR